MTSPKARQFIRNHTIALESEIEAIQNKMSEENLESAKVEHLCKRLRQATLGQVAEMENNDHTRIPVMVEDLNEGQKTFPDGSYLVRSLNSARYQLPGLRNGKLVRVGGGNRKFIVSDARGNIGKGIIILNRYEACVTVMGYCI